MRLKYVIGVILVTIYLIQLFRYPKDDRYIKEFFIEPDKTSGKFILIVTEEPSLKNGFLTLKSKLDSVCDTTFVSLPDVNSSATKNDCKKIETESYVRARIFDKVLGAIIEKSNYTSIEVGDRILVEGNIRSLIKTANQNTERTAEQIQKDKSYENYLKKEKIFYEVWIKKIHSLERNDAFHLKRSLVRIRKGVEGKIAENIARPESDLAQGLVISGKGSMSEELLEDFKRVGLIHIVVLSGSNVSIISTALFALLGNVRQSLKVIIGITSMTGFAIMTGAMPPVVRSVLMTSLPMIGKLFLEKELNQDRGQKITKAKVSFFQEKDSSIYLLFMTAMLMSIHNPLLPIYDISFQLSFMATMGLMVLTEPFTKLLSFIPEKFSIREIVAASLATQVYVAPLLLTIGNQVSIVFLIANIIVLPVLPVLMFFIGSIVFIGYTIPFLAKIIGLVTWSLLHLVIVGVGYLSDLPFATISLEIITTQTALCVYLFIIPITFQIKSLASKNWSRDQFNETI